MFEPAGINSSSTNTEWKASVFWAKMLQDLFDFWHRSTASLRLVDPPPQQLKVGSFSDDFFHQKKVASV